MVKIANRSYQVNAARNEGASVAVKAKQLLPARNKLLVEQALREQEDSASKIELLHRISANLFTEQRNEAGAREEI